MPGRAPLRGLVLGVALLAVAACSASPDQTPDPPLVLPAPSGSTPAAVAEACAALLEALPPEIDPGVERRTLADAPARLAAWGDPPIVLECGVPLPDRQEEQVQVNGLAWTVRDSGAGYRWTTRELPVPVAVEIPDAYDNPAELVNPLAEPLLTTLSD